MAENRKLAVLLAVILILASLVSFFGLSKVFSDPETFKSTIEVLDKEKNTVAAMSAASFAAAAAIDLLPGEAGKSISEALVDLGGYFVLIFAAIYLEKVLLAIGGFAAFKLLIPLGLIIIAICILVKRDGLKPAGMKMITLGLVLFMLVPSSVWVSQKIMDTANVSMDNITENLDKETDAINDSVGATGAAADANILQQLAGKAKSAISFSLDKVKELRDKMIDGVALFFVTTCLIPIIIFIILLMIINGLFGTNINVGSVMKSPMHLKSKAKKFVEGSAPEE
ncbi:MAG: hypothetical protein IJH43_02205 [Mogibacterium sp.]|nr:hypothetical protein [Mogibacterium sp.]